MQAVSSEGAIPVRTKELIVIALSILTKCEPCVKTHLDKARSMGVSEDEINEAVWLAISMGGAPIMKWYESL
jgi:AhpD family alkylhydroperoxidase